MTSANVLILNAGSSSEKLALFRTDKFDRTNPAKPAWSKNIAVKGQVTEAERTALLSAALDEIKNGGLAGFDQIDCVGHRVVHGGSEFEQPVVVTKEVLQSVNRYAQFAPLQNPFNALGIEAIAKLLPDVPQVAVFDTAFHATIPDVTKFYAVPRDWSEKFGIRRYGFHGISHSYLSKRAARLLKREQTRIVTCHLGGGASLAAVRNGLSVDTTMGFSTLEGLMMATRCGSIDPGIVLYLSENNRIPFDQLWNTLYHDSGLKGVSGVSDDLRQIEQAAAEGNDAARLAVDMFVDRLVKGIAKMVAALGGVDAIVFSGGIGENSALIRELACQRLCFLSVVLDKDKNRNVDHDMSISCEASKVDLFVIKTQEEWMIACDCHELLSK